jgi:hypothetical protein
VPSTVPHIIVKFPLLFSMFVVLANTALPARKKQNGVLNEPGPIEFEPLDIKMNSMHAEVKFLLEHGHVDILFVVSPYKNRFRYSRPCTNCIKIMRFFDVNQVVYSTGDSDVPYKIEDVNAMEFMEVSRGDSPKKLTTSM